MNKYFITTAILIALFLISCKNNSSEKMENNILLKNFDTPFGVPPFDKIKIKDYKDAFEKAMEIHNREIADIVSNTEAPTFSNTIEQLEFSGKLLNRTNTIFENLLSANTNDEMQKLAKEIAPAISSHYDEILMNPGLFKRIKSVYDNKENFDLTAEQKMLLDKTYKRFVRGGALLPEADKEKLKSINSELSVLALRFGDNVLADNNSFELVISDKKELSGLPRSVIQAAAQTAKERGKEGKWVFTLDKPSLIPFLQYADNRSLREKMFKGYITRGDNNNGNDNKNIVKQMVNLRLQKANLLGFKTAAAYILEESMAKNPANVYKLLNKITPPSIEKAKKELAGLQKLADTEKAGIKIEPWDWWYYTEKLRKQKYDFDDEILRPYFALDSVKKGLFFVYNQLYGLKFIKNDNIPVYQKDVEAYEVREADGKLTGILYLDFFPRASKRGGAWMTAFRKQHYENGKNVIPVISITTNFTKPTKNKPALLSFDEVATLFHESGHAMHGLLSDCRYESLSGTSVPRDFVEMPSQVMENWAAEPEVLKHFAHHYKTGKVIPKELIDKMEAGKRFNQGFALTEYLAASVLDMDWHTIEKSFEGKVNDFENKSMQRIGLIPEIVPRYRSTYFQHIFSGGYAAGYYSYVWAEILDADVFQAFKETSVFDKNTAQRFRREILSKGGTEDAMKLFVNFRGREPLPDAYLKRKGLE
jgi:peptidyl-dipeptidase Dcp